MDKVQKTVGSQYYTPPSEPFRIYMYFTDQLHVSTKHGHHQAGHRKENKYIHMLWDCYLNALHVLLYKNI